MNVLFSYGHVGRGGDAVQVAALAEALRALGHEVRLVGPRPLQPYEFSSAAGRVRTALRSLPWWVKDGIEWGLNARLWLNLRRLLRGRSFDLCLHRAGPYDFVGTWLARAVPGPVVVHLDAPFGVERAFRGEGYFVGGHRRAMQRLGRETRMIVTVSQASKAYYVELGLPEEKIEVLPNGVPAELLRRGKLLAAQRPPFHRPDRRVLGFVGSLSRWHRVDLLLEALRLLTQGTGPRWQLHVVGHGENVPQLQREVHALGLTQRVSWLGALPHPQAFERIAHFDVAVLPHTLSTGAPMKLFEYAALARPTIAPDLPNLRQLFAGEEMRFVTPASPTALAEAIQALAADPQAARRLGQRAQARVGDYTWERLLGQVLEKLQPR